MDRYKKYINPIYFEKNKKAIGLELLGLLAEYSSNNGNITPEEFLSSFNTSEINFVVDLIKQGTNDNFNYKSSGENKQITGTIIEDIMASLASYSILKELKEVVFKNSIEKYFSKINISTFPNMSYSFDIPLLQDDNSIIEFFNGNSEIYLNLEQDSQDILVINKKDFNLDGLKNSVDVFNRVIKFAEILKLDVETNILQVISKIKQRLRLIYSGLYNSKASLLFKNNGELNIVSINGEDIRVNLGIDSYIESVVNTWYKVREIKKTDLSNLEEKNDYEILEYLLESMIENENMYVPLYHLRNLKKGSHDLEDYFKKDGVFDTVLIPFLSKLDKENFEYSIEAILQGFTQVLILTSANKHTFLIRGSYFITEKLDSVNVLQTGAKMWTHEDSPFYTVFQEYSKQVAGSLNNIASLATLLQDGQKDYRDIITVTYIYNKKMYEKENLFAYKLYSGSNAIIPSTTKPVIGVKMDGSLYRQNIFSSNFTNIIAGSRSGKGTLTMSLLAPLLMEGKPIVYLDNKADIAALFWNLENRVNQIWGENNVRFLAIDANSQEATGEKGREGRVAYSNRHINDFNLLNIPSYLSADDYDWLKLLRNLKVLQLFLLLGYIEPVKGDLLTEDTYIFVDEITDYFNRLNSRLYRKLSTEQNNQMDNPELFNYLDNISKMIGSIKSDFNLLFTTMKGKRWAKFKFISIGQSLEFKEWNIAGQAYTNGNKKYSVDIGNPSETPFGFALSSTDGVTWLSGKGQAVSKDYDVLPSEREFLQDGEKGIPGSFIVHKKRPKVTTAMNISKYAMFENGAGGSITSDDYTFIRTYFALVSNDIEKSDVEEIRSILANEGSEALGVYLDNNKFVKYTFMFLNNVYLGAKKDGMVEECIEVALNDIYDFDNDCPRAAVGFEGLLKLLLEKKGLDLFNTSDEGIKNLFNSWNKVYDVLFGLIQNAFPNNYSTLEEYLFDVSEDSICSTSDLLNKYNKTINRKEKTQRRVNEYVHEQTSGDGNLGKSEEEIIREAEEKVAEEIAKEEEEKKLNREKEIRDALKAKFRDEFNKIKGAVGLDITAILKKLKGEKDAQIFEINKNDYISDEYKESKFKSKFIPALELVKENPEVYAECEKEIDDFINGRYASIIALTFEDTDTAKKEKEKERKEEEKEEGKQKKKDAELDEYNSPDKKSKLNGRTIDTNLSDESKGLVYNIDNTDSWDNVKASSHLTQIVIKDIKKQFGGLNGIETISVTANGCLAINGYTYSPKFDESFMDSLGAAIRHDVEDGQLYKVVNIGRVINAISANIYELSIETPKVSCNDVFKKEMGIKGDNYSVLFRTHNNLQTIYLPDDELTRNNPHQQQGSGGGLGSKLARIFGFGGNRNSENYTPNPAPSYEGNDMVDRIFDSKPVRVLTGALGWTLGCKAVVMAATIFGPWGLLFGAFAAVGAYNSMKEDRNNYSSNNRNNGSNGNYRNNSGNGSNGGNKGKSGSQGKNNKNKWN